MKPGSAPLQRPSRRAVAALLCALPLLFPVTAGATPPGGGGNKRDIPVDITFDADHTDHEGHTTGVANGIRSDSNPYADGVNVDAIVGRNNGIWLSFSGSRQLEIDFSQALGPLASVPVDLATETVNGDGTVTFDGAGADGTCDFCFLGSGQFTDPPVGSFNATDIRFEIVSGEDLDDLLADDGCVLESDARLWFTDADGTEWRITWGPREIPGWMTPNPRSDPVRIARANQVEVGGQIVSGNYWIFHSTGEHLAALHRRENASVGNYFQYYGQFKIPYSGFAVAQSYDAGLTGNHCELAIPIIGKGLEGPPVSLTHDEANNLVVATAIDHCDDFSASPASFDWYADGVLVPGQSGVGNLLDLSLVPGANSIEVVAVHPDWLAKLPDLLQITRADVEGSARITLGGGGGGTMSVEPLGSAAWSFPRGGKDLRVVITVVDSAGGPLPGVDLAATLNGPSGSFPISATTNGNGEASETLKGVADGEWCVTILDLQDPGGILVWDGVQPDPSCTTKN